MPDLKELKKRCKRYRRKRALKYLLALLIAPLLFLFFSSDNGSKPIKAIDKNITKKSTKPVTVKKNTPKRCFAIQLHYIDEKFKKRALEDIENLKKDGLECYLKQSSKFSNKFFVRCNAAYKKESLSYFSQILKNKNRKFLIVKEDCAYAKRYKIIKPARINKKVTKKVVSKESNISKEPLLKTKEAKLEHLIDIFSKRESYDLALKIANGFFTKKDYKKALKWAKIANKIDRHKEGAWILYAKTLYNLGRVDEAKEILKLYLNFKNSSKAKKLLKEWR